MAEQVRHILEKENLRAVIAELPDQAHDFEKAPAPFIVKAELGSRDREGLAWETGGKDVHRREVVADNREFFDGLKINGCGWKVVPVVRIPRDGDHDSELMSITIPK